MCEESDEPDKGKNKQRGGPKVTDVNNSETPAANSVKRTNSVSPDAKSVTRTISFETLASFLKRPDKPDEEKKEKMRCIRPSIAHVPLNTINKFCISFSGCGFLGSYHFGAVSCLVKNGQPLLSRLQRVSGASAGSLVASVLVLAPERIETCLNILYDMADELNSLKLGALTPGYYLNDKLIKIVDKQLPEDIQLARNKLFVSVTDYKTRENVLLSDFKSKAELLDVLMASCFIPMYSMGYKGIPPKINGNYYIDGGYTNNLPDFDDIRTITISPFSGVADISPSDRTFFEWQVNVASQQMNVNMQNLVRGAQALFPPKREVLKEYHNRGFKDTYRFLLNNNLLERSRGTSV